MKNWRTVWHAAYWSSAGTLALVWLAHRISDVGHVAATMLMVAGAWYGVRRLAEMDRKIKRKGRAKE